MIFICIYDGCIVEFFEVGDVLYLNDICYVYLVIFVGMKMLRFCGINLYINLNCFFCM